LCSQPKLTLPRKEMESQEAVMTSCLRDQKDGR
jgi:hypothetical protein